LSAITQKIKVGFSAFQFPLRLLGFWLLFFTLFRIWFILWFSDKWSPEAPANIWASLWHALPLDISMAAYLILFPWLLWQLGLAFGKAAQTWAKSLILWINFAFIAIAVIFFGANVFLYEEWHTLLNNRALNYMSDPAALLDSMSGIFVFASIALFFVCCWILKKTYDQIVGPTFIYKEHSRWQLGWLPIQLALLLLAVRGGTGVMPINESAVYYSSHLLDNHAATNTLWHLMHSLIETESTQNHFQFTDQQSAQKSVHALFQEQKTNQKPAVLQAGAHPNVVLIIMESMTAQVIEELGGEKELCPQLSRLIQEGILFENCYGSGYRTDQGLVSLLAGYPAQPDQSIVLLSDKAEKLPSLTQTFKKKGFSSLYAYGGELTFANIGVWLRGQGFDKVISESDFEAVDITQRWGVDDKTLLQRFAREINQLKPPFFATGMTLSLHTPYDVPYESRWKGPGDPAMFRHSVAFADHAIGAFFDTIAHQPWYDNTLFVLVADHGHSMPGSIGMDQPAARRVPLILFGKPIAEAWKGKRIATIGNHHDLAATLLAILPDFSENPFQWSRNLLNNPANGFAYYTNENGLGWVTPQGAAFYEFQSGQWRTWQGQLDEPNQWIARAYLQALYDDFLSK
jgi:phosphoglycerol transferase MdoB-like AlkP superfamily enzyme